MKDAAVRPSMLQSRLAPSFDEPIEMLEACHERMEDQLRTLDRLPDYLRTHGADAVVHEAARAVMRYFDTAAVHHHEDEDQDLFPLLRAAAARTERDEIAGALYELEKEHDTMNSLYRRLRGQLQGLADGEAIELDADDAARFTRLYRRHMRTEAQLVLPFARETLDPEQRAALGASMAARRGAAIK
jgi:hemerythrin-like domain-containing protein